MKTIQIFSLLLMFGIQSHAQLKPGDKAPAFTLADQFGNLVKSETVFGKKPVVIYFYPKDDTPGCTREACSFRDSYQDFEDAGAVVIGVSSDSPASHKKFAEKYRLPFTLLSDAQNELRQAFGVKADLFGLIPGRVTFVIDAQGIIRFVFSSQMSAEKHMEESLKAIKEL
jgi:peroxiredoxin Q/BCP